mgnify:CR=1 FL=1
MKSRASFWKMSALVLPILRSEAVTRVGGKASGGGILKSSAPAMGITLPKRLCIFFRKKLGAVETAREATSGRTPASVMNQQRKRCHKERSLLDFNQSEHRPCPPSYAGAMKRYDPAIALLVERRGKELRDLSSVAPQHPDGQGMDRAVRFG